MKISITMPNNVLISLEAEAGESGSVQEILGVVLNSVPTREGGRFDQPNEFPTRQEEPAAKSNGAMPVGDVLAMSPAQQDANKVDVGVTQEVTGGRAVSVLGNGANSGMYHAASDYPGGSLDLGHTSWDARTDFAAFCQGINPTGNMRRAVVAAEAANRFFGLTGVTADEMIELFDLVGWPRPRDLTQTIRNAARSKFGWLERIPGRAGLYAATELGRSTTHSG